MRFVLLPHGRYQYGWADLLRHRLHVGRPASLDSGRACRERLDIFQQNDIRFRKHAGELERAMARPSVIYIRTYIIRPHVLITTLQ